MKLVQVSMQYHGTVMNMLEPSLRSFISKKVKADVHFLLFEDGLPFAGFAFDKYEKTVEIKGVFSLKKGFGKELLDIIEQEAYKMYCLDGETIMLNVSCYGRFLRELYSEAGYTVYDTQKFDATKAAREWDYSRFGTPDVFSMARFIGRIFNGERSRYQIQY